MEAETENSVVENGQYTIDEIHYYSAKEKKNFFRNVTITSLDPLKKNNPNIYGALTLNSNDRAQVKIRDGKKLAGFRVANITLTKKEFDFLHDEMNVREFINVNLDASESAEINIPSNHDNIENLCKKIIESENKSQLDLTGVENEIGFDIEKQRKFISILLKRNDLVWRIKKHGVLLPKFIIAQSETIASIKDIKRLADLMMILQEVDSNLKKLTDQPQQKQKIKREKYIHGEKFRRIVSTASGRRIKNIILHPAGLSTTQFTPAEFEYYVKAHHFKNFRNCVVTGGIDLSMHMNTSKKLRTLRDFYLPDGPSINLCNTRLVGGASSRGVFSEFIFNDVTDFRNYDFTRSEFREDTNLTYVRNDGVSVTLSVAEFLKSFEKNYYQLRGGKKKSLKTDYIAELDGKSNSEKIILILKHMQEQQNRMLKFGRGHRTLDAIKLIVDPLFKQKRQLNPEPKKIVQTLLEEPTTIVSEPSAEEMSTTMELPNKELDAEENIYCFLNEYDAVSDERKNDLLERAKLSYSVLQSVNPKKANALLLEISEKMKSLNHAAFLFCSAVDTESVSKYVAKQKKLLKRFSCFEAYIGNDIENDRDSQIRRETNKNNIQFACQFLQLNGEVEAVSEFKDQLKKISYRYFNYAVLTSCRGYDENKKQMYFLDHNTPEELFIFFGVVSDAVRLEEKSDRRDDSSIKAPGFFRMPRKNITPKEEYERLCGEQWLRTPLDTLIKAGCFLCDGKIIKDELIAEAALAAQKIIFQNQIVNQLNEKQIFIAELILRGKFQVANDILIACHREWPGLTIISAINDAIQYILRQARAEVLTNLHCNGIHCQKLFMFNQSALAKHGLFTNNALVYESKQFEKNIPNNVLLTTTVQGIAELLVICPEKSIEQKCLQTLQNLASCDSLKLLIDANTVLRWISYLEKFEKCTVLGNAKCGVIRHILSILKDSRDKEPINNLHELENIMHVAFQVDAAFRMTRDAISSIFDYPKIQWAMMRDNHTKESVGRLMKVRGASAIPDADRAYTLTKKEKLIEVDGETMNVNYYKYCCAYVMQDLIDELKAASPMEVSRCLIAIIEQLKVFKENLEKVDEGNRNFSNRILMALEKMIAVEKTWRNDVMKTVSGVTRTHHEAYSFAV